MTSAQYQSYNVYRNISHVCITMGKSSVVIPGLELFAFLGTEVRLTALLYF